jgi:hypothetical protein
LALRTLVQGWSLPLVLGVLIALGALAWAIHKCGDVLSMIAVKHTLPPKSVAELMGDVFHAAWVPLVPDDAWNAIDIDREQRIEG